MIQERKHELEIVKIDQSLLKYLNEKRKQPRKISQRMLDIENSINTLEKGEAVKVPVDSERDVSNLRTWISQNRKRLKPDAGIITTVYKKEQNLLYIHREDGEKKVKGIDKSTMITK